MLLINVVFNFGGGSLYNSQPVMHFSALPIGDHFWQKINKTYIILHFLSSESKTYIFTTS